MNLHPLFVPGGVYLRTATGELIGRLDKPGAPFATLEEARDKADWLEMALQFQQAQRQRNLVGVSRSIAAGNMNTVNDRSAIGSARPHESLSVNDRGVRNK
jgi:hypothetical protein